VRKVKMEKELKDWSSTKYKTPEGSIGHPNAHRYTKKLRRARVNAVN
jgi:hypothetical protein